MSQPNIIIKSRFGKKAGRTPRNYLLRYAARKTATEPIYPVGGSSLEDQFTTFDILTERLLKGLYTEDTYQKTVDKKRLTEKVIDSSDVVFGSSGVFYNPLLLSEDLKRLEEALDEGHTLISPIVSFSYDFLKERNTLPYDFNEPTEKGGYQYHVDQLKMRHALNGAMREMTDHMQMKDALWLSTYQFDTKHVHAHVLLIDTCPLDEVSSQRLIDIDGQIEERGKLRSSDMALFKQSFDNHLYLYKDVSPLYNDVFYETKITDDMYLSHHFSKEQDDHFYKTCLSAYLNEDKALLQSLTDVYGDISYDAFSKAFSDVLFYDLEKDAARVQLEIENLKVLGETPPTMVGYFAYQNVSDLSQFSDEDIQIMRFSDGLDQDHISFEWRRRAYPRRLNEAKDEYLFFNQLHKEYNEQSLHVKLGPSQVMGELYAFEKEHYKGLTDKYLYLTEEAPSPYVQFSHYSFRGPLLGEDLESCLWDQYAFESGDKLKRISKELQGNYFKGASQYDHLTSYQTLYKTLTGQTYPFQGVLKEDLGAFSSTAYVLDEVFKQTDTRVSFQKSVSKERFDEVKWLDTLDCSYDFNEKNEMRKDLFLSYKDHVFIRDELYKNALHYLKRTDQTNTLGYRKYLNTYEQIQEEKAYVQLISKAYDPKHFDVIPLLQPIKEQEVHIKRKKSYDFSDITPLKERFNLAFLELKRLKEEKALEEVTLTQEKQVSTTPIAIDQTGVKFKERGFYMGF